jgi:hypothetical protein
MARREIRDRQYTIYFPSKDDLERWRKLSRPLTLNHWIMLMVEKSIEDEPTKTKSSDDINALRKENLELKKENKVLEAKLEQNRVREVEGLLEQARGPMPLDRHVVDLLRSGGCWPSARIIKELKITAEKEMATADGEDGLYLPSAFTSAFTSALIRGHGSEPRAVNKTLEQLETLGLVKNTWKGWVWIK